MKIIHTSDLHLDSKMDGLSSEKAKIRREEILESFKRLSVFATNNNVKAIIISGDMFDNAKISIKARNRVIETIMDNPNVEYLYLSGNHDEDSFARSLEVVPENLKFFSDDWSYFYYGNICVAGVNINPLNNKVIFDTIKLDKERVNIVALHGQVVGYKSNENAEMISLPKLADKNVDYLALGHIHSYSCGKLDNRGIYAYSGCLDGRGFDETGKKGFVLIEENNGVLTHEFVPFSSRELFEYEFDMGEFLNWYEKKTELIEKLKSIPQESLVKVVLKGNHKVDTIIDVERLNFELSSMFFFCKVYDKTTLDLNIEDYKNDKSLTGEFIRSVYESDITDDEKKQVIMCGLNAIKGEEI